VCPRYFGVHDTKALNIRFYNPPSQLMYAWVQGVLLSPTPLVLDMCMPRCIYVHIHLYLYINVKMFLNTDICICIYYIMHIIICIDLYKLHINIVFTGGLPPAIPLLSRPPCLPQPRMQPARPGGRGSTRGPPLCDSPYLSIGMGVPPEMVGMYFLYLHVCVPYCTG
jgi:hypothetical protein